MSEFKAIETQEELDRIIQDRLNRQKEKLSSDYDEIKKKYAQLEKENGTLKQTVEESKNAAANHKQELSELNAKITSYETANLKTKIALENGLPIDFADRLMGTDEASLKADAEKMAGFIKSGAPVPPLKSAEPIIIDDKTAAYKKLIEGLSPEGE